MKYRRNTILLSDVPQIYKHWVRQDEALVFSVDSPEGNSAFAVLASKRGNRAYVERSKTRLSGFEEILESDVHIDPKAATSNTVFLTLTIESVVWSLESSWLDIGREWNRFMAALRREFGRCEFFRVYQAHRSGYPHIHAIVCFKHAVLHTFVHGDKIRAQEKDDIAKCWPMGFTDVEVPGSVQEVRTHILRYIERGILQEDVDLQDVSDAAKGFRAFQERFMGVAGYQWFFRKRTFGISRQWSTRLKEFARLDSRLMHNSNCKITFLGMSSWVEARRAAYQDEGDSLRLELETLPLGLHEVAGRWGTLTNYAGMRLYPASFDVEDMREWSKDPIYDELSEKDRRRLGTIEDLRRDLDWKPAVRSWYNGKWHDVGDPERADVA